MPATEQQTGLDQLFSDLVKDEPAQGDESVKPEDSPQDQGQQEGQVSQEQVDEALAAAKDLGIDTSAFQSSAELVKAMHERLNSLQQEREQLSRYAEIGKQFAPHQDKLQELLAKQEPEKAKEDTGEWDEEKYWEGVWKAPKWDSSWDQLIRAGILQEGEGGLVKAVDPRFEPEASQVNKYLMSLRQFEQQRLASNPYKDTWEKLSPVIERTVEQKLNQLRAEIESQLAVEKTFDRYRNELVDHLWQRDPVTGEYKESEYGQRFFAYIDKLEKMGINAPEDAMIQLALDAVGRPDKPAEATPEEKSEQKKQSFLDGAKKRSGHTPQVSEPAIAGKEPSSEAELAHFIETDLTERLGLK